MLLEGLSEEILFKLRCEWMRKSKLCTLALGEDNWFALGLIAAFSHRRQHNVIGEKIKPTQNTGLVVRQSWIKSWPFNVLEGSTY